jgi:hypothetical protein
MELVTLLIAALTALAAEAARASISAYWSRLTRSKSLEIVTSDGRKFTINPSELTRERISEITDAKSPRASARAW